MVVICDWPYNNVIDLCLMARDIPKVASLPFTPTLKPFGDGKNWFFCKTSSQTEKVVATGSIPSQGIFVTLNKWVPEVNTFDSMLEISKVGFLSKGCHSTAELAILSNLSVNHLVAWKISTPVRKISLISSKRWSKSKPPEQLTFHKLFINL